ncbi:uncharacterized protein LOC136089688 [Hydra vulgaris]|uniref:Uncharacterized protein LOC136089688 n=1 Tax=Hydra vulgaris TaxID=6087 RepID=A0ABM4DBR7_HYDVU
MDAIVQIIEDWSHAKDNNKSIYAIFFDFEKAFDLVSHDKLLLKLVNILPSWLTSWIAAYLSIRQQRIKTNDHNTDWKCIEAGVLQGSILGLILFILFISDINVYLPPEIILEKYADDILTYIINDNFPTNLPQSIVDGVALWSKFHDVIDEHAGEISCELLHDVYDKDNLLQSNLKKVSHLQTDPLELRFSNYRQMNGGRFFIGLRELETFELI